MEEQAQLNKPLPIKQKQSLVSVWLQQRSPSMSSPTRLATTASPCSFGLMRFRLTRVCPGFPSNAMRNLNVPWQHSHLLTMDCFQNSVLEEAD